MTKNSGRREKKASGSKPINPSIEKQKMVGRVGIEPTTIRLKVECSTAELPARRAGDSV